MVMLRIVFFFGFFFFVSWPGPMSFGGTPLTTIIPQLPDGAQLGSERAVTGIGNAATLTGIARSQNVALFAVSADGRLMFRDSVNYTLPWAAPVGCTGPRNCYESYQASGKKTTDWNLWRPVQVSDRFDPAVQPQVLRGLDGDIRLLLSQISPERRIVSIRLSNAQPSDVYAKYHVTPVLPRRVTEIKFAHVGGRHGVQLEVVIAAMRFDDRTFQIFKALLPNGNSWSELRVKPSGQVQSSDAPIGLENYGAGDGYAAFIYRNNDEWKTRSFGIEFVPDGGSSFRDFGDGRLTGLDAAQPPKVAWLPGGYVTAVYQNQQGTLSQSLGITTAHNLGLPRGAVIHSSPVTDYRIVTNDHDVYVASLHADRRVRMHRFTFENSRATYQTILELDIPSIPKAGTLAFVHFGREVYVTFTAENGYAYWVNALRSATHSLARSLNQFHFATPEMSGLNPIDLNAWSAFGTALTAVPWTYHSLYTNQPATRCHPAGFSPPLTCGKVFFEWNDFGAIPATPGVWQTRELAIASLEDSDPLNNWALFTLKAYRGAVLLRSPFSDPASIFHEFMHELDFDGINGSLVDGLGDLRAEWNAVFSDRSGASLDGVRAKGFISDYAESNAAEDWADTATAYRWGGASFRSLASFDKALGDSRLVAKYEFVKKFFKNVEFSEFGTIFYGDAFVPLHAMRHNVYDDNILGGLPLTTVELMRDNYRLRAYGSEGWIRKTAAGEDTVPLRVFRSLLNGERVAAGHPDSIRFLESKRYEDTGLIIGYGYLNAGPNRKRMRLYYSTPRLEASTAVSSWLRAEHDSPRRYDYQRDDVYVLVSPF